MPRKPTFLRWTIEQAAREFQIDRKTLGKRLVAVSESPGADGHFGTPQIMRAISGDLAGERLKLITAQRQKAEIEVETIRRERIPLDDVETVNSRVLFNVAGILKSRLGKTLDGETLNELFTELRSASTTEKTL